MEPESKPKPGTYARFIITVNKTAETQRNMQPSYRRPKKVKLRWPDRVDPSIVPSWEQSPSERRRRQQGQGAYRISPNWTLGHHLRAVHGKGDK